MVSNREDFLMQILHCGVLDLKLIDDVNYDWCDIIETDSTFSFNLNSVMRSVFSYGFSQIETAIDGRIDVLLLEEEPTEEELEELKLLQMLTPMEDFESFHNYIDTHVWCERHGEIYQKYMQEALDDFADGTGFEIAFN